MKERRVASWTELQECLYEESWRPDLGRHRSNFAFRGRASADEPLVTSLQRLGGDARALEGHLLRNFRRYAQREDVPFDSVWNWLALGQHHGLPTRLLDWTYSPYVAVHFATSDLETFDRDGVVWRLAFVRAHEAAPEPLREALRREGMNTFTAELLEAAAGDLGAVEHLADDDFVVFLEPPAL